MKTDSPAPSSRSGFTLIELLVVIAIIAILAAILFPVFAKVRAKARQTACMSNEKQNALGVMQYIQDHDEMVPMMNYCSKGPQTVEADYCSSTGPSYVRTWVTDIQPYTKSLAITRCPDNTKNPYGYDDPPNSKYITPYVLPAYGYNYTYLNPAPYCTNLQEPADGNWGFPISVAGIDAPSATVLFTDVKIVGLDAIGYYSSVGVEAPATLGPSSIGCAYTNGAWGTGSFGDDNVNFSDTPVTGTGNFYARHTQGGNIAFCDGHVKWMTPGALAAGTNWGPTMPNSSILITDLTQYLWSTKKSGTTDM